MKKEFIVNRQGKDFVLYQGLLNEAHEQGLKRISTTLIQIPSEENGRVAIVTAEVETAQGTFGGIGDASPANVGPMIAQHIIRMAETRAKARAMRDAVNIGMTALDELGDDDHDVQHAQKSAETPQTQDFPKASPYKPASANQLSTITKLSRLLGKPEALDESMTSADASEIVTELSREYNERKTSPAGKLS